MIERRAPLARSVRHTWVAHGPGHRCTRCDRFWSGSPPPDMGCKGMKTGQGLKQGKPLKPFGRRGQRLKDEGRTNGPLCSHVRTLACLGCGRRSRDRPNVVAAHVRRRWNGWTDWLPNGDGNVVPLCVRCHNRADGRVPGHGGRAQFEADTGLELAAEARRIGLAFQP